MKWEQRARSGISALCCARGQRPQPLHASRAKGFTLLEMLAVIVLIGIIGTIVVRQVGSSVDKGKYGAGTIQLQTLGQAIDGYSLDNGTPPRQLEDLVTRPANAPNWQKPYTKASGLKDPWGHDFGYHYPGEHGSFDLIFYGQDGKPGGEGYNKDVGNWQ
ncbi:MAG: type II secretion system major pseudopilin GspG [Rhodanobacter sp.]